MLERRQNASQLGRDEAPAPEAACLERLAQSQTCRQVQKCRLGPEFGCDKIAKGTNAWVKNAAKEPQLVEDLKKASKLTIKAASSKGSQTTDSYSLAGLSQALDRVQKECQ